MDLKYDVILSPESRGFWFGLPLATKAQVSFVPVRKPGKLPRKVLTQKYELEYFYNSIIEKISIIFLVYMNLK
jgi:adenine phosphoribosyltransferase